jgi:hypothetical protein
LGRGVPCPGIRLLNLQVYYWCGGVFKDRGVKRGGGVVGRVKQLGGKK